MREGARTVVDVDVLVARFLHSVGRDGVEHGLHRVLVNVAVVEIPAVKALTKQLPQRKSIQPQREGGKAIISTF